jgi:nucleoside-diphosphate-sugar epimerase
MIAVVTGAAGFIGSHLCEHLLHAGDEVRAVDALTDYYPRSYKHANLEGLAADPGFTFVEGDLEEMPLEGLMDRAAVVYHLAGQPGVRTSWGPDFRTYVGRNVLATQNLLEACRAFPQVKFVHASSSSVYGDALTHPTSESVCPHPVSPYGVTKLAAEHLCDVYRAAFAVPTVSLRLFTVYGPRQRPDMAFAQLVRCAVHGETFELFGDGEQTRDTTFVGDVVAAMRDAATSDFVGVANIGGGVCVSMNEAVTLVTSLCGPVDVVRRRHSAGDVRHTSADTRLAASAFGYRPQTTLPAGLAAMVEWARSREAVPA